LSLCPPLQIGDLFGALQLSSICGFETGSGAWLDWKFQSSNQTITDECTYAARVHKNQHLLLPNVCQKFQCLSSASLFGLLSLHCPNSIISMYYLLQLQRFPQLLQDMQRNLIWTSMNCTPFPTTFVTEALLAAVLLQ
jgi:hypothetical protein